MGSKGLAVVLGVGMVWSGGLAAYGQQPQNMSQKPTGDVSGQRGWIEDGVAHKPGTSGDDVRKSVAGGAPLVFVDDASKRVYRIDNPEAVKGHEGHHIAFTGGIDSVNKTVHVASVSMLKSQKPGAAAEAVGH